MRFLFLVLFIFWMELQSSLGWMETDERKLHENSYAEMSFPLNNSIRKHTMSVPSKNSHSSLSLRSISPDLYMELVAGSISTGFTGDNGPATLAKIASNIPWLDSVGNVYIPDNTYRRIRKIDAAGIITTFGGTGTSSTAGIGGPIGSVSFNTPYSIVGDTAGTSLYISDLRYVWKYLFSTNIVTVFVHTIGAALGFSGDNGPATLAQLYGPSGLWLTTSGSLYIADYGNYRIRKITSSGLITTVAGNGGTGSYGDNGPATLAGLYIPYGVYVDTNGKLFIADLNNHRIRLVDTNNIITTFTGTGSPGFNGDNLPRLSAKLYNPHDVKGDSAGNIYIADYGNCVVRVVDNTGIISVLFGTPNNCGGFFSSLVVSKLSSINHVQGLWVDSSSTVYFSDGNAVRRGIGVDSERQNLFPNMFFQQIAGTGKSGPFGGDNGLATVATISSYMPWVDSVGYVYLPDFSNCRIRKVTPTGNITTFGGTGTQSTAGTSGPIGSVSFNTPYSIVGDTAGTVLYISDQRYVWKYLFSTNNITVFAHTIGATVGFSGDSGPATSAQLNTPSGLWLTTSGSVYIADTNNNRIRKVISGIITTVAGNGVVFFAGDGSPATSARVYNPQAVYMDTNGKLFIADTGNDRIRIVDTNNIITTFAGTGVVTFDSFNVPRLSANLNNPYNVKGDSFGNIYIAENSNCIVRKVGTSGITSVLFGNPGVCGFSSGVSSSVSPIGFLVGMWVDSGANIYFSDTYSIYRSFTVSSPTSQPSRQPTSRPTQPSSAPSRQPSSCPSAQPTVAPSRPTFLPTIAPSQPTSIPTRLPISCPSSQPTGVPSGQPGVKPTQFPSLQPIACPSAQPTGQPTAQPSRQPISRPTAQPTRQPSSRPSRQPNNRPTSQPTAQPAKTPSSQPTTRPSAQPSKRPSSQPTTQPIGQPTTRPSAQPSESPSSQPSSQPSVVPTQQPSSCPSCPSNRPTRIPTREPTARPSHLPSGTPSSQPSNSPIAALSEQPTVRSSSELSAQPTSIPTEQPTGFPSGYPTLRPTSAPTMFPTGIPSMQPTSCPSSLPSHLPSDQPTCLPSAQPTLQPTNSPSSCPSVQPTTNPTVAPSNQPSSLPTSDPSIVPSSQPSRRPSEQPTGQPSGSPTGLPTGNPSGQPTGRPSRQPSPSPSCLPSNIPTVLPTTGQPSAFPCDVLTSHPTSRSSSQLIAVPSEQPSMKPAQPSSFPTSSPVSRPSSHPSVQPTRVPTSQPSSPPSSQPVKRPSSCPSSQPTTRPSKRPSSQPSRSPSSQPSKQPLSRPSSQPSRQPSSQPTLQPTSSPSSSRPTSNPTLASSAPTPVPAPSFSSSPSTTRKPTRSPTMKPTRRPTVTPTVIPSCIPTVVPTPSPTFAPTNALSVFPVGSNHFRGSLFLLGIGTGSSSNLDTRNIILNNVLPGQRSFILFGQKKNNKVIPNIQIGSRESHGYYSEVVVPPSGVGGLNRDDSSSSSRSVTIVGDLNNDGFDDLLLGFPTASICLGYLGSEKGFQNLIVSFSIYGATIGDEFGWSVAKAGDVNRDQYDDMIICAKGAGVCYVLYGRSVFNDHIYVQNMSSSDGFRIIGSASSTINFGMAVDYAGDFNKDGYSDLVISAMSFTSQGIVYVIFGRLVDQLKDDIRIQEEEQEQEKSNNNINNNNNSLVYYSVITPSFSFAGLSIAGIGDMNNDGFDDIVIGSVPFRGGYQTQRTYVVFGRTAAATNRTIRSSDYSLDVSEMIVGKDGFTITGGGFVVSGVGDLNEDGIADLMIASYYDWRGGVGGKSNGYLMNYPRNMSSSPTYFPSSSPSSFPSSSPSSLPTEAATTKTPSNHPSVITAPPVLAINESASPTVVSSPKPTRKTNNPTTIKPSPSPSIASTMTMISPTTKTPTVLPMIVPSGVPFTSSVPSTRLVRPTLRFRASAHPTIPATAAPSSNQTTFLSKEISFVVVELTESIEHVGSANTNEIFSFTKPGIYHIITHPPPSNYSSKPVIKIISFQPMNDQIVIIDGFQTSSDIIDLSNFPTIQSIDDISYITNPLKILLPAMTETKSDETRRSYPQQTITLTDFISLHLLAERNFLFRPPIRGIQTLNRSFQLLLSFGILITITALVAFFKCVTEDVIEEKKEEERKKQETMMYETMESELNKEKEEEEAEREMEVPNKESIADIARPVNSVDPQDNNDDDEEAQMSQVLDTDKENREKEQDLSLKHVQNDSPHRQEVNSSSSYSRSPSYYSDPSQKITKNVPMVKDDELLSFSCSSSHSETDDSDIEGHDENDDHSDESESDGSSSDDDDGQEGNDSQRITSIHDDKDRLSLEGRQNQDEDTEKENEDDDELALSGLADNSDLEDNGTIYDLFSMEDSDDI
jgi:hypothetical protein